ncbi:MAG: hypothetical protein EBU33_09650, partial [Sphingobacteriia bacterium]|nr:hypothetical protein [Sphingobacteriia bacterium]
SWYTDYLSSLAKGVGAATTGPGAATYAGTQGLQKQAFDATGKLQGATTPYLETAAQDTRNIYQSDITTPSVPGGESRIDQFMNPYTTDVVDALGTLGKRNIEQYGIVKHCELHKPSKLPSLVLRNSMAILQLLGKA